MLWKDCVNGNLIISDEQTVLCTIDFAVWINGMLEHRYLMIGSKAENTVAYLKEIGQLK
jgi:hypothetical protein